MSPHSGPAGPKAALCIAIVSAILFCLVPASAASATDYTWSGGGGPSANNWSNGENWLGGVAPASASSIGTLTFPVLGSSAVTHNDLSSVSVNRLSVDDTHGYVINGNALTLGSGGLSLTESSAGGTFTVYPALNLAGNQTWGLAGIAGGSQAVELLGDLSGGSSNVVISLPTTGASLLLGHTEGGHVTTDDELGDLTITGVSDTANSVFVEATLNTSDGNPLSVERVALETGQHGATGPLTATSSTVRLAGGSTTGPLNLVGSRLLPSSVLHVPSASFDAASAMEVSVGGPGSEPGANYGQLNATGSVSLGEATLDLTGIGATVQFGGCSSPIGQVDSLISTTGSLSGMFSNAPNASVIAATECYALGPHGEAVPQTPPDYRIAYNTGSSPETVTATVTEEAPTTGGGTPPPSEEPSPGGSSSLPPSSSSTASTSSTGSVSPSLSSPISPVATISSAELAASLAKQLLPSGKAATITALLKAGGLVLSFKALEPGTLLVQWYEVPAGGRTAALAKAKSVLVASGQVSFTAAGTGKVKIRLTAAGRKLLMHSKTVKVEAKERFAVAGLAPASVTRPLLLRR
jgi:hypothetical protein